MRLKQLCNFAKAMKTRKVSAAFKKRAPGPLQGGLRV